MRLPPLIALIAGLAFVLAGCAGLPRHVQKTPSFALVAPEKTTLGKLVVSEEGIKNFSGIRLLSSGEEALASLIALADHAERTLDIQYYIIHQDDSTRTLLHHVRLAAERGVRVRLLVDDLNTVGEDRRFLHLSQRPNVEVRIFNPFPGGRFATWTRFVASATGHPAHQSPHAQQVVRGGQFPGHHRRTQYRRRVFHPRYAQQFHRPRRRWPPGPSWRSSPPRSMRFGTASTPIRLLPSSRKRSTRKPSCRR